MEANNGTSAPQQDPFAADKALPVSPRTRAVIQAVGDQSTLKDRVLAVTELLVEQLPDIESEMTGLRGKIASAVLSEKRQGTRGDLGVIDNRLTTGLSHLREIQRLALDLAKVVSDMDAEAGTFVTRAMERGYAPANGPQE